MINKRKAFVLLVVACIVVVMVISIPQLILSFPGKLFPEKLLSDRIVLHSDRAIETSVVWQLDSVADRLSASGFFSSRQPLQVYFCHDATLTAFLDKMSGAPTGAGFHHFSGNIYLFPDRIEKFRVENDNLSAEERLLLRYSYQEFRLMDLMVHEGLHKLHGDTLGLWTFRSKMPPPHWKAEGFSEYYAYFQQKRQDSTYNFHHRVRLYLKYKDQFPLFYLKSGLMYEFLVEQKQLTFSDMMDDAMTEESAYDALTQWYQSASTGGSDIP